MRNKLNDIVKRTIHYDNCFNVPSNGNSGGLMLLWKAEIDVHIMSYSVGHIDAIIKEHDRNWRFTGVYGHPVTERRSESWTLIKRLHSISNLPWIFGGDFKITSESEKEGGADRRHSEMNNFKEMLDLCSLMDAGFNGDQFTCTSIIRGVIFGKD